MAKKLKLRNKILLKTMHAVNNNYLHKEKDIYFFILA